LCKKESPNRKPISKPVVTSVIVVFAYHIATTNLRTTDISSQTKFTKLRVGTMDDYNRSVRR
jgi:hypothetical protein